MLNIKCVFGIWYIYKLDLILKMVAITEQHPFAIYNCFPNKESSEDADTTTSKLGDVSWTSSETAVLCCAGVVTPLSSYFAVSKLFSFGKLCKKRKKKIYIIMFQMALHNNSFEYIFHVDQVFFHQTGDCC